jgi:hypothetical protein
MQISRTVKAVGGVVLAAVVIGFTNPKAVHAVTAALVQVTNTASNPVVTQSVGPQAGNMVHLQCRVLLEKQVISPCFRVLTDGSTPPAYVVPSGEFLVITGVDLRSEVQWPCPNYFNITLVGTTLIRSSTLLHLTTTNSLTTTHFTYSSGVVIPGENNLDLLGTTVTNDDEESCVGYDDVDIYGYLTAS